ncbi:MAG: sigma-70 family RNA polymerase sigma factor [bacterium]|nr:sigma-70 family RNA polymerase sigma factor [bacterium]
MISREPFPSTRWSVVAGTAAADPTTRRAALGELCEAYWGALYAYSRSRGTDEQEAMDQVQGFMVELLDRNAITGADPDKGRFRNYLIGAFRHFLGRRARHARAQKRGGAVRTWSLDAAVVERRFQDEIATTATPQRAFDRQFALAALDRCLTRLRTDYAGRGRADVFDELARFLGTRPAAAEYHEIATRLDLNPTAVKVAVHRLRDRFRRQLLDEVAQTLTDPTATGAELRELLDALQKDPPQKDPPAV